MSSEVSLDAALEGGKKKQKIGEHKQEEGGLLINRSEFFIDDDSSRTRDARTHKSTEKEVSEEVHIPEKVRKEYFRLLRSFATGMLKLRESNPQLAVVSAQNHPGENAMLEAIVTTDNAGNQVIDEKKIKEYLKDPDHLMAVTALREERTKYRAFALGQVAVHLPAGERRRIANEILAVTGRRQGFLNKFFRWLPNPVNEKIAKVAGLVGVAGGGVGLYAAGGVPAVAFGAAAIGVAGVGIDAVRGIYEPIAWAIRNGDVDQLKFCRDAFRYVQVDPAEAAYVKAAFGIDVNDYNMAGGMITRLRQNRNKNQFVPESTVDVQDLQDSVLNGIEIRREFYEALGVPTEKLDASPEQAIYAYLDGSTEQLGTHWQQEFTRRWNPNRAGIVSRHSNPPPRGAFKYVSPMHEVGGKWVPNNNFDRNHIDMVESLKRMAKAKQETMLFFATKSLVAEQRAKLAEVGPKAIKARLEAIEGGKLKQERDEQIERQAKAIEEEANVMKGDRDALKAYSDAVGELNAAREAVTQEFGYNSLIDLNAEINRLHRVLNVDTGPTSFAGRVADLRVTRERERNRRFGLVTVSGKAAESARQTINEEVNAIYEAGMAEVRRDKEEDQTRYDRLVELRNKINSKLDALSNGADIVSAERRVLSSLESERDNLEVQMLYANAFIAHLRTLISGGTLPAELVNVISGPNNQWTTDFNTVPNVPPPAVPTYWRANIDIRSLDPQQITARLNFIHTIRTRFGTFGWNNTTVPLPPNLNHIAVTEMGWSPNADIRRNLEHARIEERALNIEPDRSAAPRAGILQNRIQLRDFQVWDNDFITHTADEIYDDIYVSVNVVAPVTGWDASLDPFTGAPTPTARTNNINLIQAVITDYRNNIYNVRLGIINREASERENIVTRLRERKNSTDDMREITDHLTHAGHLCDELPIILSDGKADLILRYIRDAAGGKPDADYVFDTSTLPNNNPVYAEMLRDGHLRTLPRGYFDMLRVLSSSNDVVWLTHVLPPERMAEMLNETAQLNLAPAVQGDIAQVLTALNTATRSGSVDPHHMRRFFIRAINYIGAQALDNSRAA